MLLLRAFVIIVLSIDCIAGSAPYRRHEAIGERAARDNIVEVDLRVTGIGLGSTLSAVTRRLGKPQRVQDENSLDDSCGPPSTFRTITYDGLAVVLLGTLDRRNFTVVSIAVTSGRWAIGRVRLGMTESEVRMILGKDYESGEEAGVRTLTYINKGNDGFAALEFRTGKLVKVSWESALC
jgi:hypothetical protein